ncbi:MAG: ABC transporter substrate-binding protein, partial [Oscillospiraceae bacterium]
TYKKGEFCNMKISKKVSAFLLACSLSLSLLAGCASTTATTSESTTDGTGSTPTINVDKKDPYYINAQKNIFRIGGGFEPPETLHANVWGANVLSNIADFTHEKLFDFVPLPEHTYMPVLGESYVQDGKTITVKLKQNVKWNDGVDFSSKDVVSNFNLGLVGNWAVWNYLDSVEATDDHTVVFNLKTDNAISTQLCLNAVMASPYHIYKEWADQMVPIIENKKAGVDGAQHDQSTLDAIAKVRTSLLDYKPDVLTLVATGPFTVANVTTAEAVLKKNPNYHTIENIKFDEVHIMRNTSMESLINLIMSKSYDMENLGLSPDVHKEVVKDNPNMRIIMGPDLGQPSLQFNTKIAPMDNVSIRKAVQYIVDRDSLMLIAEPGSEQSDLTSSGMIPAMRDKFLSKEFIDSLDTYGTDHVKAEELLTQAGWSKDKKGKWLDENGKLVELEFATTSTYPTFFLCADAIVSQLNEFGIKTTLKSMESSAYWKYLQEQGSMMSISMRPGSPNYGHPWEVFRSFFIDGAADMGFTTLAEKKSGLTNVVLTLEDGTKLDTGALLDELLDTKDQARENEIIEYFTKLTNELSVFMPLVTKYIPQKIYNPYLTGFPENRDDPLWYGGGAAKVASRLIREGKLYYTIPK